MSLRNKEKIKMWRKIHCGRHFLANTLWQTNCGRHILAYTFLRTNLVYTFWKTHCGRHILKNTGKRKRPGKCLNCIYNPVFSLGDGFAGCDYSCCSRKKQSERGKKSRLMIQITLDRWRLKVSWMMEEKWVCLKAIIT